MSCELCPFKGCTDCAHKGGTACATTHFGTPRGTIEVRKTALEVASTNSEGLTTPTVKESQWL